jgi:hypothetical protein
MNRYIAFTVLLPLIRVAACQQGNSNELKLTAAEETDSYQIYSLLLRTEMPPQWKITGWAIQQETRVFSAFNPTDDGKFGVCLRPGKDQEAIYLPLIEDYAARNRKTLLLARKFDLPQYALVDRAGMNASPGRPRVAEGLPFNTAVIFHVSAVGFNPDATRALVYVGHECGSLCGGGQYHFLMKKDGRWQIDQEYRGASCSWAS